MRTLTLLFGLSLVLASMGCVATTLVDAGGSADAGPRTDASQSDGSAGDGGDLGPRDTGAGFDVGPSVGDAGVDTGLATDLGPPLEDLGTGPVDQGPTPDEGTPLPDQGTPQGDTGPSPVPDAGPPDSGAEPDLGPPDLGPPDLGPAPGPVLTSVLPTSVVRGLSSLTINGTNLGGATQVTIGGITQPIMTNNDAQIVLSPVAAGTPLGSQPVQMSVGAFTSNTLPVTVLDRLRVVMAVALSPTRVQVTFNGNPTPASVDAADFAIPGLTVSAVSVSGAAVTLSTSGQVGGQAYTVTVAGLLDATGNDVDPAFNTAMFTGSYPTDIVVVRLGDGVAALSNGSTAVFLERRAVATGALIDTFPLPIAASGTQRAFTTAGTGVEASMSRSPDGRVLALGGYDIAPGTTGISGTTAAVAPRVAAIIRVDASGAFLVDTRTSFGTAFSGQSIRGVASDGVGAWAVGGSGSVQYVAPLDFSATQAVLQVSNTVPNMRTIAIFGGQLYASSASGAVQGIATVGTGLPTTAGQTTTQLPGFPTTTGTNSTYGFLLLDQSAAIAGLDTAYYCDDGANAATPAGIYRRTFDGSMWSAGVRVTTAGCNGLTGYAMGSDVVLFSTATGALYKVVDVGGTSMGLTPASLQIPGTNRAFRGVQIAPVP